MFTIGGGLNLRNNTFINNGGAIFQYENVYNGLIKNNNITSTLPLNPYFNISPVDYFRNGGIALSSGTNAEIDISENVINNIDAALYSINSTMKVKCNDLQNNMMVLFAATGSNINMSSDLGAGFNNASNSQTFGYFVDVCSIDCISRKTPSPSGTEYQTSRRSYRE